MMSPSPAQKTIGASSDVASPPKILEHKIPTSGRDRKSTRLNSSHDQISYAVFCLKKKKNANSRCLSSSQLQRPDERVTSYTALPVTSTVPQRIPYGTAYACTVCPVCAWPI